MDEGSFHIVTQRAPAPAVPSRRPRVHVHRTHVCSAQPPEPTRLTDIPLHCPRHRSQQKPNMTAQLSTYTKFTARARIFKKVLVGVRGENSTEGMLPARWLGPGPFPRSGCEYKHWAASLYLHPVHGGARDGRRGHPHSCTCADTLALDDASPASQEAGCKAAATQLLALPTRPPPAGARLCLS